MAALLGTLWGCGGAGDTPDTESAPAASTAAPGTIPGTIPETAPATLPETLMQTEEHSMMNVVIAVGDATFSAVFYDNPAARALLERLPVTVDMKELNGNEKYYYFDESLPAAPSRPDGIRAGDIMLYGDDCLVLFYDSFSTAYSYTPIGYIKDPAGLAAALDSGSVTVTFIRG